MANHFVWAKKWRVSEWNSLFIMYTNFNRLLTILKNCKWSPVNLLMFTGYSSSECSSNDSCCPFDRNDWWFSWFLSSFESDFNNIFMHLHVINMFKHKIISSLFFRIVNQLLMNISSVFFFTVDFFCSFSLLRRSTKKMCVDILFSTTTKIKLKLVFVTLKYFVLSNSELVECSFRFFDHTNAENISDDWYGAYTVVIICELDEYRLV